MAEERNLKLHDLLASMSGEGEVVSESGDFTIHVSKAEDKLKEFQPTNPFFYILKLVQSAVLAGATQIDVQCQAHQVSLEHDGLPPKANQLQDLLNYLFLAAEEQNSPELSSLNRLASSVNTAVAAHARELLIACSREGESYQQTWTADGTEFTTLDPTDTQQGTRFLLKRKSEDVTCALRHVGDTRLLDLVKGHRNAIQKEEAALWDRCIFSPIPIRVNGQRVDRTEFGTPRYPGYRGRLDNRVPFLFWFKNPDLYNGRACHQRFHVIQAYYPSKSPEIGLRAPEAAHSFLISLDHPHRAGESCSVILGLESHELLPNRIN